MGVRKLKPITPGQRFRVAPTFEEITKSTPEKSLLSTTTRSGGRNNQGRMTTRNIGGGHKNAGGISEKDLTKLMEKLKLFESELFNRYPHIRS